jgi:hypothetical protein
MSKITTSTILKAAVLVLLTGGIYDVRLRWHDIYIYVPSFVKFGTGVQAGVFSAISEAKILVQLPTAAARIQTRV